jgi:hypothetical protein
MQVVFAPLTADLRLAKILQLFSRHIEINDAFFPRWRG